LRCGGGTALGIERGAKPPHLGMMTAAELAYRRAGHLNTMRRQCLGDCLVAGVLCPQQQDAILVGFEDGLRRDGMLVLFGRLQQGGMNIGWRAHAAL